MLVLIPVLLTLTSAGAYWLGARRLGLSGQGLPAALGRTVECLGAILLFLLLNVSLIMAVILGIRAVSGHFLSLHLVADRTIVILSTLQGLVFEWWRTPPSGRPS